MKISLYDAAKKIKAGEVVAVPTDTVYGLVALERSQEKIYELKQRPESKPLILFIRDKVDIPSIPPEAEGFIENFWPGPLTIVLDHISYRIPNHPSLLALLKETGPLLSTSANLSGKYPALNAKEIEEQFGSDFPILEGDAPTKGIASTVIAFENQAWTILREGAITKDELQKGAIQWLTR